jgi:predicted acetyltransferase
LKLVTPSAEYLPQYVDALERGWSPNNMRPTAAGEERALIREDCAAFLASLVYLEDRGETLPLPDGTRVPRLPGFRRWIWDGEFCGSIAFRWQRGGEALPSYCLGHIGYAVVPWKQRRGYASRALRDLLPLAAAQGLRYVEITTEPENRPSRRVIEANGGELVEHFMKPPEYGGTPAVRYRIALERGATDRLQ